MLVNKPKGKHIYGLIDKPQYLITYWPMSNKLVPDIIANLEMKDGSNSVAQCKLPGYKVENNGVKVEYIQELVKLCEKSAHIMYMCVQTDHGYIL